MTADLNALLWALVLILAIGAATLGLPIDD